MSALAQALELMHTSTTRWRTLRAAGREWRHSARHRLAWERSIPHGAAVMSFGEPDDGPEPLETEERWRLWLAKPDRTRAEFPVGEEAVTAVIIGDTWWSWSPSQGVMTNAGDPNHSHGTGPADALIDPAPILPAVELDVLGRSTFLGRQALDVVARPSAIDEDDEEASDWQGASHGLGSGADEYLLLVDAERGVLLRAEARIGGAPFRVLEMNEVFFDEELPEETFTPPEAQEIDRVESSRMISLASLTEAVPFVVLVPERPPFGPPHAEIEPPDLKHGVPQQVRIDYFSPLPGEEERQFLLIESADSIPDRTWVEWQEKDDVQFGEDRRVHPALRIARLQREGTHVEIQSYGLTVAELRELAQSLVPLPAAPGP